ncbi:MAG TPA: hypothetical protein VG847_01300 [Chitinophagaceae bacterium]|nr:hypothetical protein [Chitinophagaceae bacterium]
MNLRATILAEHSRKQCDTIVAWVGGDQKRFNELFELFLNSEYRVTQRAAWPLSYCVIARPYFIQPHYGKLIANLKKPRLHDAIKRNTVRLLQVVDIPEKYEGDIMDICFQYLQSPTEAVAIKAFSITVLGHLARKYPDIIPEIKLLIEEQLPQQTPAFKSRAKWFMKEIDSFSS